MLSFDIFDTLIARRCFQPEAVFFEVERRSGVEGFARVRYAAERRVEAGDYTLADIYDQVAALGQIPLSAAHLLMDIEVAVEVDNVVPIADNIARVTSDSVLITDMYLPEHALRAMLAKAGLPSHLCLVRTTHGKRTGQVWRALAAQGLHCDHLGDNPVADVAHARASGMTGTLTTLAAPTPTEQRIAAAGAPNLAHLLRAARLATPTGALPPALQRLQVELNLPVLLLSALHLHDVARAANHARVLFSSRDSLYLHGLYDATGSGRDAVPGAYWYTSRVARAGADDGYLDYCREAMGPRPLLVDLCGTGASVARLRERLGLPTADAPLFVSEWIQSPGLEQGLAARYGLDHVDVPQHLWSDLQLVPNEVLELLNYVPEGMVRAVRRIPGGFVPVRDALEFTGATLAQVQEQARFIGGFAAAVRLGLNPAVRAEVAQHTPALVAAIGQSAPGLLAEMQSLMRAWLPAHRAHEQVLAAA